MKKYFEVWYMCDEAGETFVWNGDNTVLLYLSNYGMPSGKIGIPSLTGDSSFTQAFLDKADPKCAQNKSKLWFMSICSNYGIIFLVDPMKRNI